ncbi:hypothetical protein AC1031_020146 [Aphanomyces cochlioides]|nr:hypothetical protein AC1031_020146 [Aphanomyces cochlioides]
MVMMAWKVVALLGMQFARIHCMELADEAEACEARSDPLPKATIKSINVIHAPQTARSLLNQEASVASSPDDSIYVPQWTRHNDQEPLDSEAEEESPGSQTLPRAIEFTDHVETIEPSSPFDDSLFYELDDFEAWLTDLHTSGVIGNADISTTVEATAQESNGDIPESESVPEGLVSIDAFAIDASISHDEADDSITNDETSQKTVELAFSVAASIEGDEVTAAQEVFEQIVKSTTDVSESIDYDKPIQSQSERESTTSAPSTLPQNLENKPEISIMILDAWEEFQQWLDQWHDASLSSSWLEDFVAQSFAAAQNGYDGVSEFGSSVMAQVAANAKEIQHWWKEFVNSSDDVQLLIRNTKGLFLLALLGLIFGSVYLVLSQAPNVGMDLYRSLDEMAQVKVKFAAVLGIIISLVLLKAVWWYWLFLAVLAAFYYWSGNSTLHSKVRS